jgi:uncharacterized protein (DUF1778 family)
MATKTKKKEDSRIELRVSQADRELFEIASRMSGAKTLSAFLRQAILKEARAVVEAEQIIIASRRDQEIFFSALMGREEKPNEALLSAIRLYEEQVISR